MGLSSRTGRENPAQDDDLRSIQEARDLVRASSRAQKVYRDFDQGRVDRVCEAVVAAARGQAARLARIAVEETGFGDVASKTRKNLFATQEVWKSIQNMQTVGVLRRDEEHRVYEIAEPYGVVLGVVPVTNPTSTALFKTLIALKTRNSLVVSPHPKARHCILESVRVAQDAAARAGAPAHLVSCMQHPTLEGTQAAMRQRETALILATGGPGLVRAAYGSGKPALGVGPGNSPAYVDRSADPEHAAEAIVQSQLFDHSTICSSEQSLVVDRPLLGRFQDELRARGAHFCTAQERVALGALVVRDRALNPAIVGLPAARLAQMAGFEVAAETSVLISFETGVGWDHPLSIEKLAPILALYVVDGWREGCERCMELLDLGGRGHTIAVHTGDDEIAWAFAREKPAHRILVNTPTSQGAVGYSTFLRPSMTLGCGAFGGNIAADNISAEHLLLVKRLAWGKPGFVKEEALRRRQESWDRSPRPGTSSSPARSETLLPAELARVRVPQPRSRHWPSPPRIVPPKSSTI